MISKEAQYRMYAGTKNGDYTGWMKLQSKDKDGMDLWTLDLGKGYFLDRCAKDRKKMFSTKKVRFNNIRRDMTVEDPDGEYKDLDMNVLLDVEIVITEDSIKFTKNDSFVLLSREPVDWHTFGSGAPEFDDKDKEENWSSFYR